ncbi:unnamed protein product [Rhodiola kirilowii]
MLPDATLGHASTSHHTSTYRSFFRSVSRIYYKLSSRSSKNKDTYLSCFLLKHFRSDRRYQSRTAYVLFCEEFVVRSIR